MAEYEVTLLRKAARQNLPSCVHYLNVRELESLHTYHHSSPKTSLEQWCCDNTHSWVERTMFRESLTPNVITIVGTLPNFIMLVTMFTQVGVKLTAVEVADS